MRSCLPPPTHFCYLKLVYFLVGVDWIAQNTSRTTKRIIKFLSVGDYIVIPGQHKELLVVSVRYRLCVILLTTHEQCSNAVDCPRAINPASNGRCRVVALDEGLYQEIKMIRLLASVGSAQSVLWFTYLCVRYSVLAPRCMRYVAVRKSPTLLNASAMLFASRRIE